MSSDIRDFSSQDFDRFKDELAVMIANATIERTTSSTGILDDPRRDLYDECGYPETSELTPQKYRKQYDRNSVAARVVEVFPKECWKIQPAVYEDDNPNVFTDFEEAFNELPKLLREESWYQDDEGNPVWEHIIRADINSGIGSYGVLLLGIDDGKDLKEPVEPSEGRKLIFLRSFDETLVDIIRYEQNRSDRRFGMPTAYNVTLNDPLETRSDNIGYDTATVEVHWSRVIHLADNLGSSEIFGSPRMLPVYNRLLDLEKLYGGSAEMYWKGAFPGYLFSSDPALKGDVNWNISTIRNQIEQYFNGLQRYAAVKGMQSTSLAPQVVDPTPQINTQIEAICIRLGIPKRIFMGSERGNLASTQDENAWNDRLKYRQINYVTPRIIIPFVDRLIWMGVLPIPKGYSVFWPDLATMTGAEKADVAVKRVKAMRDYVEGNVESIMTPVDLLSRIIGFGEDEAVVIAKSAADAADEMLTEIEEEEGEEAPPDRGQQTSRQEPTTVREIPVSNIYRELSQRLRVAGCDLIKQSQNGNGKEPEVIVSEKTTDDEPIATNESQIPGTVLDHEDSLVHLGMDDSGVGIKKSQGDSEKEITLDLGMIKNELERRKKEKQRQEAKL